MIPKQEIFIKLGEFKAESKEEYLEKDLYIKAKFLEVLIDIRDILENKLQDIAEPIKHIANNHGGNF